MSMSGNRRTVVDIVHDLNTHKFHHNNVRPANIVCNVTGEIKFIDFHLAGPCDCPFGQCDELKNLLKIPAIAQRNLAVAATLLL